MSDRGVQWGRWKPIGEGPDDISEPEVAESEVPTGTFIGSDARFEGTLHLQGDFRIDCEFRGELRTDGTLTVGESGSVEGDIHAREVEIRGAVAGNVIARRLLVLCEGARLHGDVETACFEVQRHAFFQGTTAMTRPQASTRPVASQGDVPAPADSVPEPPA